MKNRIASLLLALTLLFSLVSCKKEEVIPPKDKVLTVETEAAVYTEEGILIICERLASAFVDAAPRLGYPTLDAQKEREIAEMIRTDIIPVMREIPIYENELFDLVEGLEYCLEKQKEENKDEIDTGLLPELYIEFSGAIDTDRTGRLAYRLQIMRLEKKLSDAEDRYNKNGYGLESVTHYRELIASAKELGEVKFADALSSMMLMLISSAGVFDIGTDAMSISSSDALVVLGEEAERLTSLTLSDGEWQTVAAMCEENIPSSAGEDLKSKILLSLNNDDFFVGAATLIPDIIDFYAAMVGGATEEAIDKLSRDGEFSYEIAVYGEMIKNEAALRTLLDKISEELPRVGRFSQSGVKAYDKAGYEDFLGEPTASAEELIAAIRTFVESPTSATLEALEDTRCAYLASLNSVVAYVYFYQ